MAAARVLAVLAALAVALATLGAAPARADCPGWEPDMPKVREMLLTLMGALDEADVPYWINYGTLLGAIREGDTIEGDDDADLGMDVRYMDQVWNSKEVHATLQEKGFQLVRSMNNDFKVYPISKKCAKKGMTDAYFKNCCENVDVFFYKKQGKCMVRDCFHDWKQPCPYPANNDLTLDSFPAAFVSKIIKFTGNDVESTFGRSLPVPAHYNKFLAHVYGSNWRTPAKGRKHPNDGRKGCTP